MSESSVKLGAVVVVTWLLFATLTAPVGATVTSTGLLAAGNGAAVAGNVVYQTDSGLTVTDTTGADVSGNPFTDSTTLALPDLTLSAAGNAQTAVTVDQRTGTETQLSGIDTAGTDVTVDPNDKQSVTIGGGIQLLNYRGPTFEVTGADIDFDYEADSTASLEYPNAVLSDGTTVEAIDTSDGTVLDTASAGSMGMLDFS